MFCVVSSLFWVLCFRHEGKIVTIVQLSFFSSGSLNDNVPYVGNYEIPYESVGADLFKHFTLMRNFTIPTSHVHSINMISVSTDSWIIPTLDQIDLFGDSMPLSPLEQKYQEIVLASMTTLENHNVFSMNLDTYVPSPWLGSQDSLDPLNETFPTDESIVEVMSLDETPWNGLHQCSPFLPNLDEIPSYLEAFVSHCPTPPLQTHVLVHSVLLEGNMGNITATMPLNIFVKPKIVENIHIGVSHSPDEIRVYTQLFK